MEERGWTITIARAVPTLSEGREMGTQMQWR